MSSRRAHQLSDLDQQEVVGWSAHEMALAENADWEVKDSGWQVPVPGAVVWSHPSVPFLQAIELVAHLADGRIFSLLSQPDDGSAFHGLYLLHRQAPWPPPSDSVASIYRTRELAELPVGRITTLTLRRDSTESVMEMMCTVGSKVIRFLSGEVYDRDGGRFEIVEGDESILVQVDGKMPAPA
jgi:hypothetical protein